MIAATISYESWFTAEHEPPSMTRHANAFRFVVSVDGPLAAGIVVPFETIGATVANLLRCIEAVPPIEALPNGSSTEQIAVWIWHELVDVLPGLASVALSDGPFTVTYRGHR